MEKVEAAEWLDVHAAAAYVGVKVRWVRQRLYDGDIPYSNPTGRKCFIRRTDLEKFMESGLRQRNAGRKAAASIEWD